MSKKIISLLLAVMLTVSMVAVAAVSVSAETGEGTTYVVAGSEEVFGEHWNFGTETNVMTEVDGVYTLTLEDVQPFSNAQFKIGVITADGSGKKGEGAIGVGADGNISTDAGAFNFQFNVVEACDVTITYDPAAAKVTVEGDGVVDVAFEVESIRAVGNGTAGWLNDINWNPAADENLMEEISKGVYQLVIYDVEANDSAELKFAANGDWGDNWGGTFAGLDVETEAVYNGSNIVVVIGEGDDDENLYEVTITLDLTGFNYGTKSGAKFTVSQKVQDDDIEDTTATEATEATDATEVTDATETTAVVPAGDSLTVNATSNFFSKVEAKYNADTDRIRVSYYIESDKDILNFQIGTKDVDSTVIDGLTYDPEVLKVVDDWKNRDTLPMTGVGGCVINLRGVSGSIKLNGSNLNLWEIDSTKPFLEVEFEVLDITGKGAVTTTIGCELESMIVAALDDNEEVDASSEDYLVKDKIANLENISKNNVKATTTLWPEPLPTDPEDTTAATDATEDTTATDATEDTTATDATEDTTATDATEDTTVTDATEDTTATANVITANSNLLPTDTYAAEVGEIVNVEYSFTANVLSTQWTLIYDPAVLELITTNNFMPQITAGADYNLSVAGAVEGSASNLNLYNVTADAPFVNAQFKKIAEGDTTVTLFVSVLETAELNEDGTVNEDSQVRVVFNGMLIEDITTVSDLNTVISSVQDDTTAPDETTATEDTTAAEDTTATAEETIATDGTDFTEATDATENSTAAEGTTAAPVDEPTEATTTVEVPTQPATDNGSSTSDTPTKPAGTADTPNSNGGNGTVQTGDASMAIIILSVLVAGTAVMFVLRKREMF